MARQASIHRRVGMGLVLLALLGLGSATSRSASGDPPPALCGTAVGQTPHISKVLWIVMENTSYGRGPMQIPGSASASYINGTLLAQCGSTSNLHAVTHPSYPNYLAATSGSTQGVDSDTLGYFAGPNLFAQVDPSWRGYEQYMQQPCHHYWQTGDATTHQYYVGKHNPAASYSSLPVGAPTAGDCRTNDIAMGSTTSGALLTDIQAGTLPKFAMITPGLCDDMHALPAGDATCPDPIAGGDHWLAAWIPLLTSGPDYVNGNLLINIMWDEGRGSTIPKGGDCTVSQLPECIIPNIVISPYTSHIVSPTNYSLYSLLKTTERIFGLPYLGHAGDAATKDMCQEFGICSAQGQPPIASFTVTCTVMTCSTDASGSQAPGSTITSYAWDFGDGGLASGVTATHTYAQSGTYSITLTVTNAEGATGSTSHQVTVPNASVPITFRASASTTGNWTSETVDVPSSVSAGDGMLLLATCGSSNSLTGPAGWSQVDSVTNGAITTTLWSRVATSTDPGQKVTVGFATVGKGSVQLLAYAGTSPSGFVGAVARAATSGSRSSATTPTVAVARSDSWLVSYWAAKSSAITGWTTPAGQLVRSTAYGTGGGRITSVATDFGTAVPAGTAGGLTATTDQPESAGTTWSIVLNPVGP